MPVTASPDGEDCQRVRHGGQSGSDGRHLMRQGMPVHEDPILGRDAGVLGQGRQSGWQRRGEPQGRKPAGVRQGGHVAEAMRRGREATLSGPSVRAECQGRKVARSLKSQLTGHTTRVLDRHGWIARTFLDRWSFPVMAMPEQQAPAGSVNQARIFLTTWASLTPVIR